MANALNAINMVAMRAAAGTWSINTPTIAAVKDTAPLEDKIAIKIISMRKKRI